MLKLFLWCVTLVQLLNNALCAQMTFDVSLETPNLLLECKYTLDKNEKFNQISIKKDGEIFFQFDGKAPKFDKVEGIDEVEMVDEGRVIIKNYKESTFGTFQCLVFYKKNRIDSLVSQTRKLTFTKAKCSPVWNSASKGNLPSDTLIGGVNQGVSYAFCRFTFEDTVTPGMVDTKSDNGCVITWNGGTKTKETDYEVLSATGFEWAKQANGAGAPINAYQAGHDCDGNSPRPIFIGKCTDVDSKYRIGKIDFISKMYYTSDGKNEVTNCQEPHEIFVCN